MTAILSLLAAIGAAAVIILIVTRPIRRNRENKEHIVGLSMKNWEGPDR